MTIYWTDKNDLVLLQATTEYKFFKLQKIALLISRLEVISR